MISDTCEICGATVWARKEVYAFRCKACDTRIHAEYMVDPNVPGKAWQRADDMRSALFHRAVMTARRNGTIGNEQAIDGDALYTF